MSSKAFSRKTPVGSPSWRSITPPSTSSQKHPCNSGPNGGSESFELKGNHSTPKFSEIKFAPNDFETFCSGLVFPQLFFLVHQIWKYPFSEPQKTTKKSLLRLGSNGTCFERHGVQDGHMVTAAIKHRRLPRNTLVQIPPFQKGGKSKVMVGKVEKKEQTSKKCLAFLAGDLNKICLGEAKSWLKQKSKICWKSHRRPAILWSLFFGANAKPGRETARTSKVQIHSLILVYQILLFLLQATTSFSGRVLRPAIANALLVCNMFFSLCMHRAQKNCKSGTRHQHNANKPPFSVTGCALQMHVTVTLSANGRLNICMLSGVERGSRQDPAQQPRQSHLPNASPRQPQVGPFWKGLRTANSSFELYQLDETSNLEGVVPRRSWSQPKPSKKWPWLPAFSKCSRARLWSSSMDEQPSKFTEVVALPSAKTWRWPQSKTNRQCVKGPLSWGKWLNDSNWS